MAKALGKNEECVTFFPTGQKLSKMCGDNSSGWMRPRSLDGKLARAIQPILSSPLVLWKVPPHNNLLGSCLTICKAFLNLMGW